MPRTIVCGVDTSDASKAAADTARRLADGLGARLVLLHVSEEPAEEAEQLLANLRVSLRLGDSDEVRLVEGAPADRLLESVDADGAELIVVGTRGRGSLRSAVFGSVSRRLATDATCPVVVVPPDGAPVSGEGGSVVVGVDGSDHALAAARLAQDLASRLGLRLLVVHALAGLESYVSYPGARDTAPGPSAQPDTGARLAQEIVGAAVEAVGGGATGVVEDGLPWDVLQAVAEREDGRLLVVAARGLSATRAAVFGSATTELATNGRYPVAILPEAAEAAAGSPGAA